MSKTAAAVVLPLAAQPGQVVQGCILPVKIQRLSVLEKIAYLEQMDPDCMSAVDVCIGMAIEARWEKQHPKRRDLLTQLRAVHTCRRSDLPRFVQEPPSSSGVREWRCDACHHLVSLDGDLQ